MEGGHTQSRGKSRLSLTLLGGNDLAARNDTDSQTLLDSHLDLSASIVQGFPLSKAFSPPVFVFLNPTSYLLDPTCVPKFTLPNLHTM